MHRPKQVVGPGAGNQATEAKTAYYADGKVEKREEKVLDKNGVGTWRATDYQYDALRPMTRVEEPSAAGGLSTSLYEYDANGNVTKATENGRATVYAYDPLDRHSTATGPAAAG